MTDIIGKLWGFCYTLRQDGIDYGDYIEQLTHLLFLKMIEEKGACSSLMNVVPQGGRQADFLKLHEILRNVYQNRLYN